MTSQTRSQTTAIHIPTNTSRTKSNQALKFRQFIEYNTGNIFLDKSYTKCGGEANPRTFSKTQN